MTSHGRTVANACAASFLFGLGAEHHMIAGRVPVNHIAGIGVPPLGTNAPLGGITHFGKNGCGGMEERRMVWVLGRHIRTVCPDAVGPSRWNRTVPGEFVEVLP
jgi:hypothetical protein